MQFFRDVLILEARIQQNSLLQGRDYWLFECYVFFVSGLHAKNLNVVEMIKIRQRIDIPFNNRDGTIHSMYDTYSSARFLGIYSNNVNSHATN